MHSAGSLQIQVGLARVDPAKCADAMVSFENLVAQIAGIGPKPPFVHTPVGTEGEPPGGNLQVAPATQGAAAGSLFERGPIGETAGHGSGCAQSLYYVT